MLRLLAPLFAALCSLGPAQAHAGISPPTIFDLWLTTMPYCPPDSIQLRGQVLDANKAWSFETNKTDFYWYPFSTKAVLFIRDTIGTRFGGDGRTTFGLPRREAPGYANDPKALSSPAPLICMQTAGDLPDGDSWQAFDVLQPASAAEVADATVGQLYLLPREATSCYSSPRAVFADGGVHDLDDTPDFFSAVGTGFGGDGRSSMGYPKLDDVDGMRWCVVVDGPYVPRPDHGF